MTLVYRARVGIPWTRPAGLDLVRVDDGTTLTVRTAPCPWRLAHFPRNAYRTDVKTLARAGAFNRGAELRCDGVLALLAVYALAQSAWGF